MKHIYYKTIKLVFFSIFLLGTSWTFAQNVPELMYYNFNTSGAQDNLASSPVGNDPSSIVGTSLTIGTPAQFGNALKGTGASSTSNYVNNGWSTNLVSTPWTISMWINNIPSGTALYYLFGDAGNAMRGFVNGAPGSGNMRLTGTGLPLVDVTGVTGGTYVMHFVRTVSPNEIKVYKNGTYISTHTITGTPTTGSGFRIGGYSTTAGLNGEMDEFRMYNRALSATEISNTWNKTLGGANAPDNAGVVKSTYPQNFCQGTHDVKVLIENAGSNILDSVRLNWTLNGATQIPVIIKTAIDTIGSSSGNTSEITLGSVNFSSPAVKNFKVWTSHPNGVTDAVNSNDTIYFSLKPSLSGAFTIGGTTPDYNTISDAVDDLNSYGVCGPVTFTIRAGTYAEQVAIGKVTGASATNTITFDGVSASTRTLTFAGVTGNPHTLKLDGSNHVTIKNLTIINTASTNAFTVHITNQADSNTISNCVIRASTTATATTSIALGIMGATYATAGDHGNYNTISNCVIEGGYATVVFYGTSLAIPANGNTLLDCNLSGAYTYGVYSYYQGGNNYLGNTVFLRTGTTASYGIYCVNNTNGFKVERNKIKSYTYGIYFSSCNTTGSTRASVTNNMIWGQGATTVYQIYCTTLTNSNLYHNTTYNTAAGGYGLYMTAGTGNIIRNNIFMKTVANTYCAYIVGTASLSGMDYNNYYSTVPGNFVYIAAAYTTLASLKTLTAYNQNSISMLPNFVSTLSGSEDLHLTSGVPAPYGLNLGVTKDVDDEVRCLFAPTLGADESKYIVLAPVADFTLPDSIFLNSPVTILNAAASNESKAHVWYLNGVNISAALHLVRTFTTTGTNSLKLVTQSCGGFDSITKTFDVYNPTRVPESDFVSDKNQIEAYEDVQFTDLSINGASQWNWTVLPSTGVTITNPSSQNPVMSFILPGDYRVCLTAFNALGSGTAECKSAYIRVGDLQYICGANDFTQASLGTIYDAGGPITNYGDNENCTFLIDPCASSVTIKFNAFSLGNVGDQLKIYDGMDASGILIGTYTSTSSTPGGNNGLTAGSGKLFLQWKTDGATTGQGFEAVWTSVPANFAKPAVSFTLPDTAYTNQPVHFTSNTTGLYLNYSWDVDAPNNTPGNYGGIMDHETFIYTATGHYFVKLTVSNCGGIDTLTKMIVVENPTTAPYPVDFTADITRLTLQDTAQLADISGHGASSWKWSANPSAGVIFFPNNTVYNPKITISTPGVYDIKLVVSNSIGSDSITKIGFLRVVTYCFPGVANLNTDLGISSVKLKGTGNTEINNTSVIGQSGYTDYTQTLQRALLELGGDYKLEVERNTTNNKMNRKLWIDYNGDGDFNDPGETVAAEASAQTLIWTVNFTVPNTATIGYTRFRIGTNINNLSNQACGPNTYGEFEDYRVIISSDVTKPVITRAGNDTVYIEQYRAYVDAGATAFDNLNGNLTADMYANSKTFVTPATTFPGTYILTFNVTDSSGNAAEQKTRTVMVFPDTTRPELILNGPAYLKVQANTIYTSPGALQATDFRSGGNIIIPIITIVSNVDISVLGIYTEEYSAIDSAGNMVQVFRTVEVTDTVKPTIVLVGTDPDYVEVKTVYTDPFVTVTDDYYGQSALTVTSDAASQVNTNVLGTYLVTYTATDGSGNTAILTRNVIVRDTQKPLVVLKGSAIETVEVHSPVFNDPGADVTDNFDTPGYSTIGSVDLHKLGDYILRYFAIDNSGNMSDTVDRIVRVVDTQAPVIRLRGDDFIYIERWVPYIDSGAIAEDNYNTGLTVTVTNNVTTLYQGIFFVYYDAVDSSGNVAQRISRTVLVGPNTTGIAAETVENGLLLYPNPSQGMITISMQKENPVVAEVYNVLGELVESISSEGIAVNKLHLDLGSRADGIYYIKVQAGEQIFTSKMLLSK